MSYSKRQTAIGYSRPLSPPQCYSHELRSGEFTNDKFVSQLNETNSGEANPRP